MQGTVRSMQSKPVTRTVPMAQGTLPMKLAPFNRSRAKPGVYYLGRNTTDHTVTLSINGQRYEYYLTPTQCDTVEYLCKKVSALKALSFAKSRAASVIKI